MRPSRTSLFTGSTPVSRVRNTDGLGKSPHGPGIKWFEADDLPTMGHWFRAAGCRTFYCGRWHVSQADLIDPQTGEGLLTKDGDGNVLSDALDAYRRADQLEPFGFSGWLGPEPHGANPANAAFVRDPLCADQTVEFLDSLGQEGADAQPWLGVASFLNPHDIAFSGGPWNSFGSPAIPDWVPAVPEAPSQSDSLGERPACQAAFREAWPKMVLSTVVDGEYRRFYHDLLVDERQKKRLTPPDGH